MDVIALLLGLLLLWAFGIACLAALPNLSTRTNQPGGVPWMIGAGGLAGLFIATLWLRALSFVGIHFSVVAIALPFLAATLARGGWVALRRRRTPREPLTISWRNIVAALSGRSLDGSARVLWRLLLLWLALRFALLFVEVATRPLFPWDSWTQWATKARVWYELGRIVPFAAP